MIPALVALTLVAWQNPVGEYELKAGDKIKAGVPYKLPQQYGALRPLFAKDRYDAYEFVSVVDYDMCLFGMWDRLSEYDRSQAIERKAETLGGIYNALDAGDKFLALPRGTLLEVLKNETVNPRIMTVASFDQDIQQIRVLDGEMKGRELWQSQAFNVRLLGPGLYEPAFLYVSKVGTDFEPTVGAFDLAVLRQYLEAVDNGDTTLQKGLKSLDRAFEIPINTGAAIIDISHGALRVDITDGPMKGRKAWIKRSTQHSYMALDSKGAPVGASKSAPKAKKPPNAKSR